MTDQPSWDAGDWASTLEPMIEMVDPEQLLAHPANARIHPAGQRTALRTALDNVGWVAPVVVNRRTERILDGHLRAEEALSRGAFVPVAYVNLDETAEPYVLATLDTIGTMAEFDPKRMADLLNQISTSAGEHLDSILDQIAGADEVVNLIDSLGKPPEPEPQHKVEYSRDIEPPIYVPSSTNPPPLESLVDHGKRDELVATIEAADIPADVAEFLILAAARHARFHFGRIAEYYSHAPEPIRALIEASGLVIVDLDQAIELGFVEVSTKLTDLIARVQAEREQADG